MCFSTAGVVLGLGVAVAAVLLRADLIAGWGFLNAKPVWREDDDAAEVGEWFTT